MAVRGVLGAELIKLRTLPLAVLTSLLTVAAGAAIAAALAGGSPEAAPLSAAEAVQSAVPFIQAGVILFGVLPAAHEYAGGQIRTSLAAVPNRRRYLVAKTLAALLSTGGLAIAAVGGSLAAALLVRGAGTSVPSASEAWSLAGAAGYLMLIGLFAHATALLVRHLTPSLGSLLTLVLVVSPLLGTMTEHARWLPDRAGRVLYLPDVDPGLGTTAGGLVLLGWIGVVGVVATVMFARRDA